jgi:hypothetical protein
MPNTPEDVFVQNVVILNHHMAAVAKDIAAGKMGKAAVSLKLIGEAARWLSESLTNPKAQPPQQMLPGQSCRPKMIGLDPLKR